MVRICLVALLTLCCCTALAAPVIDGSAKDPLYGPALAVQDTQTGYGDANLGRPDVCNGSELDAAYGVVYDGMLYLVLAGNFETNGNKLELFFDTRPGGQNRLLAQNPGPDQNTGIRRMSDNGNPETPGLTFAGGFEADFWVSVGCYGDPVSIYVDYAELYVNESNPGVLYYCGAGQARCQTTGGALTGGETGAPAILVTVDNSNVAGVDGGSAFSDGSGVSTGIEIAIPLSALGNPTGDIRVTAIIGDPQHASFSNQVLGGLFGSANLGESRAVNLANTAHAPFTVPGTVPHVGACCTGTSCAVTTQAACVGSGKVYLGDNTSCDGNPCTPAFGRCCVDDGYAGQCYVVENQAECDALGGTFTPNEACDGCPCLLPPSGACCLGNTCAIMREAACTAGGGSYVGHYTNCGSAPCEAGACCLGLTCSEVRRFECNDPLAIFYAGTACAENPCAAPTIATPYVAGDFNGWNAGDPAYQMEETAPGSRIWTKLVTGLTPGSRHLFKITDGTWTHNLPSSNSWFYADANGECLVTYDSNFYSDGWAPARDRLPLPPACVPESWVAAGNFQHFFGGSDWDRNSTYTVMQPQGNGVYKFEGTGVTPGPYFWKAVLTAPPGIPPDWESVSWDARSINTANMQFTVSAVTDVIKLWVDAVTGVVKVEVGPAGPALCPGDTNCDGEITFADIDNFVEALGGEENWTHAPCPWLNADCNGDNDVTFADIDAFVALIGTSCP